MYEIVGLTLNSNLYESQVEMLNLIMCNVTAWYVNCIEEADGYSAFHALQTCERIENRSAHSITCFTVRITY